MEWNVQKYQVLQAVVDTGSFTRAAELLNYSQSGISRMIADLEKEWKLTLLERGRNGIQLTSDGERILPFVREVLSKMDELEKQVDELNGLESGLIRIGTISSVAVHWLPSIIRKFQEDYPRVDYEVLLGDYTEIEDWLLDGRVDIGFLRLPADSRLETEFLEQDRLLAVLPENHPLSSREKFPIYALSEEPFMLMEKGAKAEVSELLERVGVHPQIHFTTWDDYAILAMVEGGLGISILPEMILRNTPYRIVAKELEIPAFRRLGAAVRSREALSRCGHRFMEYLHYRKPE